MWRLFNRKAITGLSFVGLFVLLGGCSSNEAYLPLRKGQSWRYYAHEATGSRIRNIRVGEPCLVGNSHGFKLVGDGGTSKLAWISGELWVSEFAAMRFDPPIAFLKPGLASSKWSYEGVGTSRIFQQRISAQLKQSPTKLEVMGQMRNALLVALQFEFQGKRIELETWFQKGLGILKQEQRIDGIRVFALEWVGGS